MTKPFSYSLDDCNVHDREKLARYRELATVWHDLLHGDERHSISGQLSDMLWQDAAWRTANEARRYADTDGPTSAIAPLLGGMLDRGYVAGQVIAISRLLEKPASDAKKGVVSLRRIVDEMRSNRALFTREIFVSNDALPYDWEAVRTSYLAQHDIADGTVRWMDHNGPAAWSTASGRHAAFDRLSGIAEGDRKRDDLIAAEVFDHLDAALKTPVFTEIMALRNKSVAHAADAFSRSQVPNLRLGFKLDELARAHFILLGVFQAISAELLYGSWRGGAVPDAQYDLFAHIDRPFVPAARMEELHRFWTSHCDERDEWLSKSFSEMLPTIVRAQGTPEGQR